MFGDNLERIVAAIEKNYEADEIFFTKPGRRFPSRTAIKGLITELRRVLFPGYFGPEMLSPSTSPSYFIGQTLIDIESVLRQQLILALTYTSDDRDDLVGSGNHLCGGCTSDSICEQTADICTKFFDALPEIQRTLLTDVQALYDGDPAAGSKEEVIFTYPGLYAIYVYRIAHVLYELGRAHHPARDDRNRPLFHGHRHRRRRSYRRVLLHRPRHWRCHRRDHHYR